MELAIYLISLIISAIPAGFLTAPSVEDALGTITTSAFLAGVDYREFMVAEGYYYKYGHSLMYLPVFWCVSEPIARYRIMLVLNSALEAFIPVIAYRIGHRHLGLEKRVSACMAIVTGLMPPVLLNAKYTWAEPSLFLAPWVAVLLILEIREIANNQADGREKKGLIRLLSGLLAWVIVYAFMAHQRGIVLVIAVIITIVLDKLLHGKWPGDPFAFGVNLVIALAVDRLVSLWQREVVYLGVAPKYNTLRNFLKPEIYTRLFSAEGLGVVGRTVLGWLYNCGVSGLGLTFVGLIYMIILTAGMFSAGKQRKHFVSNGVCADDADSKAAVISLFALLLFVGSFLLGILFFFETLYGYWSGTAVERCDHLVFGRYLESSYPMLVFMGIFGLYKADKRDKIKICSITVCIMSGLTVFFVLRLAPAMEGIDSYVHSLMSLNYTFDMEGVTITRDVIANLPKALIFSGIISVILFILIVLLEMHGRRLLAGLTVAVVFVFIYLHSFTDIIYRVDSLGMTRFAMVYLGK